jgi:hypothetical protein
MARIRLLHRPGEADMGGRIMPPAVKPAGEGRRPVAALHKSVLPPVPGVLRLDAALECGGSTPPLPLRLTLSLPLSLSLTLTLPLSLSVILILILTLSLASPSPASARELWASADGETAWEAGGTLKEQVLGAWFRDLPFFQEDAGLRATSRLRLDTAFHWKSLDLDAAYEFRFTAMTAGFEGTAGLGLGSTAARPRLWDAPSHSSPGCLVEHDIDRLSISFAAGAADIRIGRQAVSWGSAWFWKPTDRFGPFSPLDVDPDVKRGVDAVRAEVFFGARSSLDMVATFERDPDDPDRDFRIHGGARFRTGFARYDLALSLARFQMAREGNWMIGAEFTGEIGQIGIRGEAAVNVMEDSRAWDIEVVLGADHRFKSKTTLAGELFYNGYGTARPAGYAAFLFDRIRGERLARGEAFHVGRWYAGIAVSQEAHPLVTVNVSVIANLQDPSAMLVGGLQWSMAQDARLSAGLMVPVGRSPALEPTMFGIPVLRTRSEFGMSPLVGYLVMRLSF